MQYISELGDWIKTAAVAYLKYDAEMNARAVEIAKMFDEADKHAADNSDDYECLTQEANAALKQFKQEIYTKLVRDDKCQFIWDGIINDLKESQVPDDLIAEELIAAAKETAK